MPGSPVFSINFTNRLIPAKPKYLMSIGNSQAILKYFIDLKSETSVNQTLDLRSIKNFRIAWLFLIGDIYWKYRTAGARSIQLKFAEISVQNSMHRFAPTGKVSKKRVHLWRWSSFPGRTGWNFGWMDRAPGHVVFWKPWPVTGHIATAKTETFHHLL